MSDPSDHINTPADTHNHEANSRRDFLLAGAGIVGAAAAAPLLSAPAEAQVNDNDLTTALSRPRILIKGGVVLSLDRAVGDFAQGDVLIEDGTIRDVGPGITASDAAVINAANHIVIPGFVDTHHHFYQGILRNILPNGLLNPDYQRDISNTLTAAYLPDDVYAGSLITALGMIDHGTTTAVDTSQVQHTRAHTDASIRALQESGLRVVYAYSRGTGPAAQFPQDVMRLARTTFSSKSQLLTLALGTGLDETMFRAAREAGVPTVSHGVNNNTEQALFALNRAGLLKPGDEYIHCTHLSDAAWKLIKDTGGHVSLAVPIEMAMGHGLPPIQDALDHGIRPSLSSDVDVTMAQDPFTVMRAAFTLQRLGVLQRARTGAQNLPPLLTCRDVLEFATIEGARCTGLDNKVGTLTPGKDADIVLLKADRLNVWPLNNAAGAVVNLMNPSNVETVFIAGKPRKWRGNLVGVSVPRMLRLAAQARDGVVRRSGFKLDLLG
ncbi:MAG TPA: amidohydrolase family protein [Xanthobacteraceae bacterium]|jgi:cytosine/adenosine deaminase-related metal-dependent hydrolase|nr:amidohydrolase family protein [Xanthobacteraceae bacterium]